MDHLASQPVSAVIGHQTDKPKCCNCRFYFGDRNEEAEGDCRRRAPAPSLYVSRQLLWMFAHVHDHYLDVETASIEIDPDGDRVLYVDWPIVHAFQWCGEFETQPKDCTKTDQ